MSHERIYLCTICYKVVPDIYAEPGDHVHLGVEGSWILIGPQKASDKLLDTRLRVAERLYQEERDRTKRIVEAEVEASNNLAFEAKRKMVPDYQKYEYARDVIERLAHELFESGSASQKDEGKVKT